MQAKRGEMIPKYNLLVLMYNRNRCLCIIRYLIEWHKKNWLCKGPNFTKHLRILPVFRFFLYLCISYPLLSERLQTRYIYLIFIQLHIRDQIKQKTQHIEIFFRHVSDVLCFTVTISTYRICSQFLLNDICLFLSISDILLSFSDVSQDLSICFWVFLFYLSMSKLFMSNFVFLLSISDLTYLRIVFAHPAYPKIFRYK